MTDDPNAHHRNEEAAQETAGTRVQAGEKFKLTLYVTGHTPRSIAAIAAIRSICSERLQGCVELEIVDVYQDATVLEDEPVVATPMLVKQMPASRRKLVGDMTNRERVLAGLDLAPI
ncbi:MAG: circadian clock protein KaiB [Chloroflexi bacterium]|nr:circadian clock protein KaiB [Chloroflexota bacterium]